MLLPANTKATNVPPGPSLKGGKSKKKTRKSKTRKHRK
uniref:Uncharacterized protein n=1 Tax=viral metagenome TaxID=1070528 RepID=A0A6C0DJF2_9ZZZZ